MNNFWEEVASGVSSKGGQAVTEGRESERVTWEQQKKQHWPRLCDGAREPVYSGNERNAVE